MRGHGRSCATFLLAPIAPTRPINAPVEAGDLGRKTWEKPLDQDVTLVQAGHDDDLHAGGTLARIRQSPNLRGIVMESPPTHGRTRAGTHP